MALTQEEMEQMPKPIEQAFSDLELKILEDIVARIKENNMITATAEYDIFQLVKMGESEKMIKRYVEKTLKLTYSEIEDIFGDVFERGYNRDSNLYKAVGADFVAYKDNKQLQQFIGAIKDQTKGTYKNITNTMGFVRQREGVKTWVPLTKYYKDTLSRAVFEITSGAFSYSQVIKRTINEMTNSGIRTIDYASGRTSRIEVAARRAIMTAVTQVTAKVTEQNMEKLHTDYVEVSWHETARPTHQVWQGRVFKWNRENEVNAVSDKAQSEEQLLRNDSEYQDAIRQRREEWKKKHSEFDKVNAKTEINNIKSQIEDMQKQINASLEKEKPLEKKVYIDGTGTDEDMRILRQSATERKKLQEQVEVLNNNMLDKQEVYKNEAQNRILKAGTVEEIKLSKKMTPETVDALEEALTKLKDKYGIMPKGVVYNPAKVPDATVTYNWLDDKIYISNKFNDINNYADVVKKSENSLIEHRKKSGIVKIQKERLKDAEEILSNKNVKGYERAKAVINKAEAKIELNTQRMAVRENLMDTLTHEYGHFIHRHANADYVQKSSVFGAKDLGGKLISGDWKYDINSHYSANAKIEAAKISKYATESPYEAFAEGFLAKEKGQKIPENIEKVIEEAKVKAGVKKTVRHHEKGYIGNNAQRIGSNSINLDYINSEAYANKFKKISKDNELNNLIYNKSIELLRNNNNSDTEGLCIITVPNKQVLLNVRGERDALGVELSKKQSSIVKNCKMEIVGIHNHPTNLLPNGSDFTAAGYRGYKYGIVVTHDGRIYKYSVGNRPFLPALLDSRIDKYCAKEYNLNTREAYEKALNEFRKEYGISWQEIE